MSNTVTDIQGISSSSSPSAEASAGDEARHAPREGPESDPRSYEEHVLQPTRGWIPIDWRELVRFRELLFFMIWRDVKVRYKQTVLGAAWAVIVPLIQTIVFTVIFSKMAGLSFGAGAPDAVVIYASMLGWSMFQAGVTQSGMSLMAQRNLLTKIYFPRLYVPVSSVGTAVVDAMIMVLVLGVLLAITLTVPAWTMVLLPLLFLLTVVAVLGFGLVLSAMTVSYRDFRYVIPFMMQVMMLLSCVQYPVTTVAKLGDWAPYVASLNPMFGLVVNFRGAVFSDLPMQPGMLAISTVVALVMFAFGLFFFRRTERRFADIA